jgi:hypothetical protein
MVFDQLRTRWFTAMVTLSALSQLTGSSAPQWFGTWKNAQGSLTISRDAKDPAMAFVEARIATTDGCTGKAAGRVPSRQLGRLQAAVKVGHPDDNQELCTMAMTLVDEASAINVKLEGACTDLHGASCDFRGRYVRR